MPGLEASSNPPGISDSCPWKPGSFKVMYYDLHAVRRPSHVEIPRECDLKRQGHCGYCALHESQEVMAFSPVQP